MSLRLKKVGMVYTVCKQIIWNLYGFTVYPIVQ